MAWALTPLLHTLQGNLLITTGLGALRALTMIFVLLTFIRTPFVSKLVFQMRNISNNSPSVSAMIIRSSA